MKYTKILFFMFIIAILLNSCIKTKMPYPGVRLYKTKGDYFDKVTVGINKKGEIYRIPYIHSKVYITKTDTCLKYKTKLINNYVLDGESNCKTDAFLSISYKKLLLWEEEHGGNFIINDDTAWKYMLDKDPYIEYYIVKDNDMFLRHSDTIDTICVDTTGLNQIIKEGRIEEYFTKIK